MRKFGRICLFLFLVILAFRFIATYGAWSKIDSPSNQMQQTSVPMAAPSAEPLAEPPAEPSKSPSEKELEEARKLYAKTFENNLLAQGMNVDIDAIGSRYTTLRVKWILATKVDAYQITNSDQELFQEMRAAGFKKFVVWDGYDQSWTWSL